jgi:hypothetical protein
MKKIILPLLLLGLCACVDIPPGMLPEDASASKQPVAIPYKDLDPGYKTQESAHFSLKAYTSVAASQYSTMCEDDYTRIMQDLGLYSFVPARPYNVIVYKDAAEYHSKTGQPEWSGGATYGNALLLYEGSGLAATTAHEMTHLVFNEFMGLSQSSADSLRWLNEGVAVYEQCRSDQTSASNYAARLANSVASNPIPFAQMVNLAPQNESEQNVDRWYAQVWSVASFMITQGGSFNFSVFLTKLRAGESVDKAIADTYTNGWKKLSDVENQWLLYIKK